MKTNPIRFLVIVAVSMLAAQSGRADAASYAQLIKERDSVLSQILADRESRRTSGLADEDAIATAQLALYSFRRDTVATLTEKIKNQEFIVGVHQKKLDHVKAMTNTGVGSSIQVLEATAPLLEAKQILEELRLNEKKG